MPNRLSREARDDADFRLLRLLGEHPEYSQRQMGSELGISLGRINYCLRALVERGWIKVERFKTSDRKLAYLHVLTPKGVAERARLTSTFLKRKLVEYDEVRAEIAALEREMNGVSKARARR